MAAGRSLARRLARLLILSLSLMGACAGDGPRSVPLEGGLGSAVPSPSLGAGTRSAVAQSSALDLAKVDGASRRDQIVRVVASMDETGTPPPGVAQGGRRGGRKGVFVNAEGRLPRKPLGYWVESDVWPKAGPRGAERLVFGREREVYWTRDHYETFVRLR